MYILGALALVLLSLLIGAFAWRTRRSDDRPLVSASVSGWRHVPYTIRVLCATLHAEALVEVTVVYSRHGRQVRAVGVFRAADTQVGAPTPVDMRRIKLEEPLRVEVRLHPLSERVWRAVTRDESQLLDELGGDGATGQRVFRPRIV